MWYLLAEVKEELLKDEDGPRAAEDDERLPGEEAEQGTSHGGAQEALHYSLLHEREGGSGRQKGLFGAAVSSEIKTFHSAGKLLKL